MKTLPLLAMLAGGLATAAPAQILPSSANPRSSYFTGVSAAAERMARNLERAAIADSVQLALTFADEIVWTQSHGAPVRGRRNVAAAFRAAAPRLRDFRVELTELDASDRMAFVTGRFRYVRAAPAGAAAEAAPPFAAALVRERDNTWRIRLLTGGDLPASLVATARSADSARVGSTVSFTVELRDGGGAPSTDSRLRLDVLSGGGTLSPSTVTTDSAGRAQVQLVLGPRAGAQVVRVTSVALPNTVLDLAVTALPGPPAAVVLLADSAANVRPGSEWPSPVRVRVEDAFGNPLAGVAVAIAASGAGVLGESRLRTGADGTASTALRTSNVPGDIFLEARAGALGAELALRTVPGLAAQLELPAQGVELVERTNRETGARALDGLGRPTDDPPLTLQMRDAGVAFVTDDARVVGVAPGQSWMVARAGDVLDSVWVTVRPADGSTIVGSSRVLRGRGDSLVELELTLVPSVDTLRITGASAVITLDTSAVRLERIDGSTAPTGLRVTPSPSGQIITVEYAAPSAGRRPGDGVRGRLPLARLLLRLGAAGRSGVIRTVVNRIDVPPRAAPIPLPVPFVIPVFVTPPSSDVRERPLPPPLRVP